MRKYLYVYMLAVRGCFKKIAEIFLRSIFFFVILLIFSKVWSATLGLKYLVNFESKQFLWYLYFTELIFLSLGIVHVNIDRDIKSGNVVTYIIKPLSFTSYHLAYSFGEYTVRFAILGVIGFICCYGLTGTLPILESFNLVYAFFLCFFAGIVQINCLSIVGLSAAYIGDSTPIYWLWQRMMIVCGGLLVPINFYPERFKQVLSYLPFSALLGGPASLIFDWNNWKQAFLGVFSYFLLSILVQIVVNIKISKQLETYGG